MNWEQKTKEQFEQMIAKVPIFLREMVRDKVSQCAEKIAKDDHRSEVIEKDMVVAFFKETPGGFWGPLQVDFESLNIDYTQYGYNRV